jgi:riboflavin transporter FmnP
MKNPISSVKAFVAVVAVCAAAAIAATAPATATAVADAPGESVAILALTLALQLVTLRLPGMGSIGFSSLGLVLAAITLGPGPAMAIGALAAVAQWIRRRGLLHRAVFDAANLALSAGAAAGTYAASTTATSTGTRDFVAAAAGGAVYVAVNHVLLCMAMSVAESRPAREVWRERFHWARYYLVAFTPLAGATTVGDEPLRFGIIFSLALSLLLLAQMRRGAQSHERRLA